MWKRWLEVTLVAASMLVLSCDKDDSNGDYETVEEAFARLEANNSIESIEWSDTGIPVYIRGEVAATAMTQDPEENLFRFLEEYAPLFRMKNPRQEWRIWQSMQSVIGYRIRMHQLYRELEVDQTSFTAYFDENLNIKEIFCSYLDGMRIHITPSISETAAISIALAVADTQSSSTYTETPPQLRIFHRQYPVIQGPLLSWQLMVMCNGLPWNYVIDAHSGDYIDRFELWVE